MKHLKEIGLVVMMLVIMMPMHANAEGLGNARLSLMDGDVQIRSEDSSEWFPASVNMPLREGDSIWVPEGGRAEVQLSGGTQVRLDEFSSLDLLNISGDSSQFHLTEGSAYINFRGGRNNGLIQIDTPVSSVRAYDRAAFNVDVASSGDTDVSVYKGLVHAESGSGSTRVTAGNTLEISYDYADIFPLGRADAWERWNTDRDRRFEERRFSSQYLPDELENYASDFDDNGRWISVRGYGYVWTPTVQVSFGWSPYRNGRWCWIGGDYVWIGYEPWGWAPYHYGRWAYAASVGWFWVPPVRGSVYWGPGYVGWVRTPTYVAWVPLAPRETYYGYGYYGPDSVNIINVNINTLVVKNTYKNVYVTNGVTVLHHDTFTKGRQVDFKMRDNPFLREKISIGRPDIKPERESRMAVIRDIPRAKEPPKKIREIKIREIRESRPMVRDRDKSVFSPGKSHKQMNVRPVEAAKERKRDRSDEKSKDRERTPKGLEQQPPSQKREQKQVEPQGRQPEQPRQEEVKPERKQKRELRPADENRPEESGVKQKEQTPAQDRQIQRREQKQVEPQGRQPEQPRQEEVKPERAKKREFRTPDESRPDQQRLKQKESAPAPDRQMQREERQQKPQDKQPDKKDMKQEKPKEKDKGKKGREDKDEEKQPGAGQQPPAR